MTKPEVDEADSADTNAEPQGKSSVQKLNEKRLAFSESPLGIMLRGLLWICLTAGGLVFLWDPISSFYSSISLFPLNTQAKLTLVVIGLPTLAYMILRPPENPYLRLFGFVVIIGVALPFVMASTASEPHQLVVVYEESHPQMHPRSLAGAKAYPLSEILKLEQVGEIESSSTFVSIVDRPSIRWGKIFESGFNAKEPILSLQEVLDKDTTRFVDLSFSSYEQELSSFIGKIAPESLKLFVFFERDYFLAEDQFRETIREQHPTTPITSIVFDGKEQSLEVAVNSTVIYLGSPESFGHFMLLTTELAYVRLLVPNWIRSHIGVKKPLQEARNLVLLSSTLENLSERDDEQWEKILSLILDAKEHERDVRGHLSSALIQGRTLVQVGF